MITLIINNEIIKKLKQEGFYADTMLAAYASLMGLHLGKIELLDIFDDYNGSRRAVMVYYDLVDKGFWREAVNPPLNFEETEKGTMFCEELLQLTMEKVGSNTKEEVGDWIQSWVELFPKGVKSGGKLLRSDKKSVLKKMEKFVKDYKFSKELIMRATESYLNEREKDGWMYTKCATYFIDKLGQGSELAAQCENLKDEKEQPLLFTQNTGLI